MLSFIQTLDESFLLWIQETVRTPILTSIMQFFSSLLDHGILAIVLCIGLLLFKRTRKMGITASLSLIICSIIVHLFLKPTIARPRPYHVLDILITLAQHPNDYSFPSGHTNAIFAVAGVLFFACPKKVGVPAIVTASLVGLSRVYLGVHFLTDVLVGALLGLLISYLCCRGMHILYVSKKLGRKKSSCYNER